MKISTKGRYALRIMLDLAVNGKETCIPLRDISKRQGVTIKYMEQIMPLLTKTGFVKSFRGNNGGYKLSKSASEYTLGEIIRATEGSMAPISCLEDRPNRCGRYDECKTIAFWEGLYKVMNEYMDQFTLEDLLENKINI